MISLWRLNVFKKIKFILKLMGCLKLKTTEDHILQLLHYINDINIYNNDVYITLISIHSDVITYNEHLNNILKQNLNDPNLYVKDVTERNVVKLDIKRWYSDNGYIIPDNEPLKFFLHNCLALNSWYNANKDSTQPNLMYTIRRLRPYINNIHDIVIVLTTMIKT